MEKQDVGSIWLRKKTPFTWWKFSVAVPVHIHTYVVGLLLFERGAHHAWQSYKFLSFRFNHLCTERTLKYHFYYSSATKQIYLDFSLKLRLIEFKVSHFVRQLSGEDREENLCSTTVYFISNEHTAGK